MPRAVESHLLQQRVPSPGRARLHLCGSTLIVAEADTDGPWARGLFPHPDAAAAQLDRDRILTQLARTGYHLVTRQRFTVPAATAMRAHRQLDVLDGPFETAWAQTWAPALDALRDAAARDAGNPEHPAPPAHLVLLANYPRHTAHHPWGPALEDVLKTAPQALHADTGLLLAGVGSAVLTWLHSYYASSLERTPPVIPAHPDDTSLTYTFALGVWQPTLDGPVSELVAALVTARDMAAPT